MKKEYGAPKAEKMEFNYSEAVVASGTGCQYFITETNAPTGCKDDKIKEWTNNVTN